ncbi:Arylsulfatase [Frankliniella fusca]|uniref:Arylsulfatase n=1 Tax=Frankliniella fusca TaxID=407009 RepID=A0AAE1LKF4_9NEOP|nr:Arylsulfatase [Frankliniella fusca]
MGRTMMFRYVNNPRRLFIFVIVSFCLYGVVQIIRTVMDNGLEDLDRAQQLKEMLGEFNRAIKMDVKNVGQVCRHPNLPVNSPEMMKFIKDVEKFHCDSEKNWVEVNGSTAFITDEAKALHGELECTFTDIHRNNEYTTGDGLTTSTHHEYNLEASDFVKVYCKSESGNYWNSILAGIRHSEEIVDRIGWDQVPADGLGLSVIMWGMDSISRNNFIRKLPRTHKFLTETLGALVLEGYNIVGDGTPQALIPILTGSTELELPETRKRKGSRATYVDAYPFIWKDFQSNGYVTGYVEDQPEIGTFTYRLKGFNKPPVDHYGRSFYLAAESHWRNDKRCLGSQECHKIMLGYTENFMSVYRDKPYFMLSFLAQLSHDNVNLVGTMDEDLHAWLVNVHERGFLNNTLLIVFSDHGPRFADIRQTIQGKQEERLPFFSFTFPPWFKQKHPEAYSNFLANTKRLSSPFDIYATLKHVIHFPSKLVENDLKNRSMSLFNKIPLARSCAHAHIEAHWCACLDWDVVSHSDRAIQEGAKEFISFLNNFTLPQRKLCADLSLDEIIWSARLRPNQKLLAFHHSSDPDGFKPDLSGSQRANTEMLQIKLRTKPGNGLYEVSMSHNLVTGHYNIKIQDVSRINKYGSAAHCVMETNQDLRKYCFCKDPPATF